MNEFSSMIDALFMLSIEHLVTAEISYTYKFFDIFIKSIV